MGTISKNKHNNEDLYNISPQVFIFTILYLLSQIILFANNCYANILTKKVLPLSNYKILIDPGHGGSDSGAVGPTGLKESEVNLKVAKYLHKLLFYLGAETYLTRSDDKFLSLEERINIANKVQPDLFISIHHNSSYDNNTQNYTEIYFNPYDNGFSHYFSNVLAESFRNIFKTQTYVKPGGFYILRNNYYSSVLLEGHFINIKEIEQKLKLNSFLVLEAQAIKDALLKCISKLQIKADFLGTKPFTIDTPYAKFVLVSNQPIASFSYVTSPPIDYKFTIEKSLFSNNIYIINNSLPFLNGEYKTIFTFNSQNVFSNPVILDYSVKLPPAKAKIIPIIDFIPSNFEGDFPLEVNFYDNLGRPVHEIPKLDLIALANGNTIEDVKFSNGKALLLLNVNNYKNYKLAKNAIIVEIRYKHNILDRIELPFKDDNRKIILGKITNAKNNNPLEKTAVYVEKLKFAKSNSFGYFILLLPNYINNLTIKIQNTIGYFPSRIKVSFPKNCKFLKYNIQIIPIYANLLDKKVAIICDRNFQKENKDIIKTLRASGVKIIRYDIDYDKPNMLFEVVKNINLYRNLDLVLSVKYSNKSNHKNNKKIVLRHYHKSTLGKKIANNMKKFYKDKKFIVQFGSDYELGNTGATALVMEIPQNKLSKLSNEIVTAFLNAWNISYE